MCNVNRNMSIKILRDITLKSVEKGNDLVYFIEENVSEMPTFLPCFYNIPDLKLQLNMVRDLGNDLFEFGGRYEEEAVTGYLSFNGNTISTTMTYLHNKESLASFEQNRAIKLQRA